MLQRTIHRPIPASSEQEPTHLKNTFEKEKNAVDVPLSNRFRHSQPKSRETEKQEKVWVNRLLPSCNHEFRGGGESLVSGSICHRLNHLSPQCQSKR